METLFVVDVPINWASDRNWQTKVLDTWRVTQLNVLHQESVKNTLEGMLGTVSITMYIILCIYACVPFLLIFLFFLFLLSQIIYPVRICFLA